MSLRRGWENEQSGCSHIARDAMWHSSLNDRVRAQVSRVVTEPVRRTSARSKPVPLRPSCLSDEEAWVSESVRGRWQTSRRPTACVQRREPRYRCSRIPEEFWESMISRIVAEQRWFWSSAHAQSQQDTSHLPRSLVSV